MGRAREERASKQSKWQVLAGTGLRPDKQRLQRLSRGACVWRPGGSGRVVTMDWADMVRIPIPDRANLSKAGGTGMVVRSQEESFMAALIFMGEPDSSQQAGGRALGD